MTSDIEVISIKEMAFFADAEHMINRKDLKRSRVRNEEIALNC
jgi:hypothetical protein